ncbi:MAG TPA: hypothetical protein VFQ92_11000 [Blastocatellia bacterium]|nr:hypothetical protein [Blastocatellia bacterium]
MQRLFSVLLIILLGCIAGSTGETSVVPEITEPVQSRLIDLKLKAEDLHALARNEVIVSRLPTRNSKQMGAFGAVLVNSKPEAFVESYRSLAAFNQNPSVMASGRLSPTPSLESLNSLTIDDKDLYALTKCRVQKSDVKLSAEDIAKFQSVAGSAPRLTPRIKAQLTAEYKKLLIERVQTYMAKGSAALGNLVDRGEPVGVHDTFVSLAREQAASAGHCKHLYSHLEYYPEGVGPDSESFIYWAKQRFGSLKPVINLVHVVIHREGGRVFIASKQIYSSHYTEGGLSVAELIPFTDNQGQSHTLILYWIRLQVDMLGGTLGFIKKRMAQPRILSTLKESLKGVRAAMEREQP